MPVESRPNLRLNGGRREPKVIFVAHQLDSTGAPHVFIDLVTDFRKKYSNYPFEFHTFSPVNNDNIKRLNKDGIKPKLHLNKDISLGFIKNDVVVLNTVAFSDVFMDALFDAVSEGRVKHLIWYVHEDEPEKIFHKNKTRIISKLLDCCH